MLSGLGRSFELQQVGVKLFLPCALCGCLLTAKEGSLSVTLVTGLILKYNCFLRFVFVVRVDRWLKTLCSYTRKPWM